VRPALTDRKRASVFTGVGAVTKSELEPVPSCPKSFAPQQYTTPAMDSAQLWKPPLLTATARRSPKTGVGEIAVVVVPFPTCPQRL
jgi:hypothetical protein